VLVAEVIHDLRKRFPRSPIEAWEQSYRDALGPMDGEKLGFAYRETMREWVEPGPPKPAHILAYVRSQPKPEPIDKRQPWEIRDDNIAGRARRLYETACREVGPGHEDTHMHFHLRGLTKRVATLMIVDGMSAGDALAKINAKDNRPKLGGAHPYRAPDVWADDIDREIFAQRVESQMRISKGRGSLGRVG